MSPHSDCIKVRFFFQDLDKLCSRFIFKHVLLMLVLVWLFMECGLSVIGSDWQGLVGSGYSKT